MHVRAQICHLKSANQLLRGCNSEATLHTGCRYAGELMCASASAQRRQITGGESTIWEVVECCICIVKGHVPEL